MKKILKAIGFGIVLGAAVFFVPFIFKFILIVMLIGMVFRMFAYKRRRYFNQRFGGYYPHHFEPITPIDGQWYRPDIQGNGITNSINVN